MQLRLGTHHIQPVVGPRHKGAVGDDALIAPLDGADQHIGLAVAVGLSQTAAHKEILRLRLQADHVDEAASKRLHGDGGGKAEDTGDLLRRRQIGVDDHIQPDLPLEDVRIPAVLGVAYTGDGVAGAQTLCHQAADHIGIVHAGDGDDQIRRADAGIHQYADGCAAAVDTHDIQRVVRLGQMGDLVVHHNDVMLFLLHLACNGVPHLTAAYDNDLHASSSPPDGGAAFFFCCARAADSSAPKISTCPDIYSHSSTTTMVAIEPYSRAYWATFST